MQHKKSNRGLELLEEEAILTHAEIAAIPTSNILKYLAGTLKDPEQVMLIHHGMKLSGLFNQTVNSLRSLKSKGYSDEEILRLEDNFKKKQSRKFKRYASNN